MTDQDLAVLDSYASPADTAGERLRTEATTSIVGYRLRRAQLAVFQQFLAVFEALELRPAEYSVLVLVADNPGRRQTEIAEALGIKRANFVTLLHGLEARGLVKRRASAGDRRANALFLSAKGTRFLAAAQERHDELERQVVERLGGTEARRQLLDLLERLC